LRRGNAHACDRGRKLRRQRPHALHVANDDARAVHLAGIVADDLTRHRVDLDGIHREELAVDAHLVQHGRVLARGAALHARGQLPIVGEILVHTERKRPLIEAIARLLVVVVIAALSKDRALLVEPE